MVFIKGLWLLPSSWDRWGQFFSEAGYAPLTPDWPDDPETVQEAGANPDVLAKKTLTQVADHTTEIINAMDKRPAVLGHSTGGLLAQMLAGGGLSAATVAIDPGVFRAWCLLPASALKLSGPFLINRSHAAARSPSRSTSASSRPSRARPPDSGGFSTRVLDQIVRERGAGPELVRMDNGPEMTANALRDWCRFSGAGRSFIEPGSLWQDPFVESFGSRVRDEVSSVEAFDSVIEAHTVINDWKDIDNNQRPYSRHGWRSPAAFRRYRDRRSPARPTPTVIAAAGPTNWAPSPRLTALLAND